MNSARDIPLDRPLRNPGHPAEAVVQDRPTLSAMPMARRGPGWWLLPAIDFACSGAALVALCAAVGVGAVPAFPVAPFILVLVYGLLGVYGAHLSRGFVAGEDGAGWPVIRLLVAALFAWSASLLTPLNGAQQLILWIGFVLIDGSSRALLMPYLLRMNRTER